MIATILAAVAGVLVLGAVAAAVLWLVLGTERVVDELDAEQAARSTEGPYRVHPAPDDDLMDVAEAFTDHTGRAL